MENMLEEAFDLAEEDFAQRQLLEARVESTILRDAEGREAARAAPRRPERAVDRRAAAELREACSGTDHNRIRDLVEASTRRAVRSRSGSWTPVKVALESRKRPTRSPDHEATFLPMNITGWTAWTFRTATTACRGVDPRLALQNNIRLDHNRRQLICPARPAT